jgi:parvulin-like peptidyl-prolyl isomerase
MNRKRSIAALGAFFVTALTVSACGSGVPGNSVADVAGNPITQQAFNHWMYVFAKGSVQSPNQPVIVPNDPPNFAGCIKQARAQIPALAKTSDKTLRSECGQLFTSLSGQVLDFLIRSYWFQAQAAAANVKVTDAQVMQQFETEKKQSFSTDAAFNSFLKQRGETLQDILYNVRVSLLFQKLRDKHTKPVTPAAVKTYYDTHTSQYGTPDTRDVRIVLAKTAKDALAAKAALQSGHSWAQVAKKYSTDPTTKDSGGLLVGVTRGKEDPALDSAAFSAPVNALIGPVKAVAPATGYYVLQVVHDKAATQETLAQATQQIDQVLTTQSQTSAQTAITSAAKARWLSQTTCRTYYSMVDCNGYQAPSTSTSTPTATTG